MKKNKALFQLTKVALGASIIFHSNLLFSGHNDCSILSDEQTTFYSGELKDNPSKFIPTQENKINLREFEALAKRVHPKYPFKNFDGMELLASDGRIFRFKMDLVKGKARLMVEKYFSKDSSTNDVYTFALGEYVNFLDGVKDLEAANAVFQMGKDGLPELTAINQKSFSVLTESMCQQPGEPVVRASANSYDCTFIQVPSFYIWRENFIFNPTAYLKTMVSKGNDLDLFQVLKVQKENVADLWRWNDSQKGILSEYVIKTNKGNFGTVTISFTFNKNHSNRLLSEDIPTISFDLGEIFTNPLLPNTRIESLISSYAKIMIGIPLKGTKFSKKLYFDADAPIRYEGPSPLGSDFGDYYTSAPEKDADLSIELIDLKNGKAQDSIERYKVTVKSLNGAVLHAPIEGFCKL